MPGMHPGGNVFVIQGRLAYRLDQRTFQGPGGNQWPRGFEEHPVQQATRRQGIAGLKRAVFCADFSGILTW